MWVESGFISICRRSSGLGRPECWSLWMAPVHAGHELGTGRCGDPIVTGGKLRTVTRHPEPSEVLCFCVTLLSLFLTRYDIIVHRKNAASTAEGLPQAWLRG
jgi:hypothetical protein